MSFIDIKLHKLFIFLRKDFYSYLHGWGSEELRKKLNIIHSVKIP